MEIHSSSSKLENPKSASSVQISTKDSDSVLQTPLPTGAIAQPAPPAVLASSQKKPLAEKGSSSRAVSLDLSTTEIVPFDEPFTGFGGHLFLYFCKLIELCFGWTRLKSGQRSSAAESLLTSTRLKHWGACSLGTICCTVIAAVLIPLFSGSSIKSFLPLPFLLIIIPVAFRFGRAAGVLGTLIAAFLFAYFLFEPAGLAVADPVAREHLIWMLIIGVVISDLLARWRAHRMHMDKL